MKNLYIWCCMSKAKLLSIVRWDMYQRIAKHISRGHEKKQSQRQRSDMPWLQMSHEAKVEDFLLLFSPRGDMV